MNTATITQEEIQQRIAASQQRAATTRPVPSKNRARVMLSTLEEEGLLTRHEDGRLSINGNTIFFSHYRNERRDNYLVYRTPEGYYLQPETSITLAYYFDGNTIVAAVTVKNSNDNYDRRFGNALAVDRLARNNEKYVLRINEEEVLSQLNNEESLIDQASKLVSGLFGGALSTVVHKFFGEVKETMGVRDVSHYVLHDIILEKFRENCHFVDEILYPEEGV